ncbi:hypothetical protein BDW66DRAFT_134431 [Aspergillus desertorum]
MKVTANTYVRSGRANPAFTITHRVNALCMTGPESLNSTSPPVYASILKTIIRKSLTYAIKDKLRPTGTPSIRNHFVHSTIKHPDPFSHTSPKDVTTDPEPPDPYRSIPRAIAYHALPRQQARPPYPVGHCSSLETKAKE